jgi:hypothetical protein
MRKTSGKTEGWSMAKSEGLSILASVAKDTKGLGADLYDKLDAFEANEPAQLGRAPITASYLADLIDSIYTCLEILFLRISRFFENELETDRRHQDLLDKMRIEVSGVRAAVLSDATFGRLGEMLRFRHFRRYYFEMDYDWDKLDFLLKKLQELRSLITGDLDGFLEFLSRLGDIT